MIAGFVPDKTGIEKIGERRGESEADLTDEEKRELAEKNIVGDDFSQVEFPPFNPDGQPAPNSINVDEVTAAPALAAEAATAMAGIGIAETIIDQPAESGESTGVYNANGEAGRRAETVTEQAARSHVENNDTNIAHLVSDVAGTAPGGRQTIIQDSITAEGNATIAKSEADNLRAKVAAGESDGKKEGEDILVSAMTATAGAKEAAEQAGIDALNNNPNTDSSITSAQNAISRATELKQSLSEAANAVGNVETQNNMLTAVQKIEEELAPAQDTLTAALEVKASEEQNGESGEGETEQLEESGESTPMVPGEVGDQLGTGIPGSNPELSATLAPGQVDANTIRQLQEKRESDRQAALQEAIRIKNEQAANENQEGRQNI